MKSLELFYEVKDYLTMEWGSSAIEELDIIEKSLKALEIIKVHYVSISLLCKFNKLEDYNLCMEKRYMKLTQEEYDLLKEVLL